MSVEVGPFFRSFLVDSRSNFTDLAAFVNITSSARSAVATEADAVRGCSATKHTVGSADATHAAASADTTHIAGRADAACAICPAGRRRTPSAGYTTAEAER